MHHNTGTLIALKNSGLIKISGNDAKKFLQGQLTCNVDDITSDNGMLGAHCNPQGRIISLFRLIEFQQHLYLAMPRNMIAIAMAALKKYAVFFKVDISDASDELMVFGLINATPDSLHDSPSYVAIKIPSSSMRYFMLVEQQTLPHQSQDMTDNDWKELDIQDGIPTLHPETSGVFLPHELNLDKLNALSFNKGCYTGQEIIARMHYRGKLKSRMHKASIISQTALMPGCDIFITENEQPRATGKVIDASMGADNCYNALITLDESSIHHQQIYLEHHQQAYFTLTD